jgi:hypothetical protein
MFDVANVRVGGRRGVVALGKALSERYRTAGKKSDRCDAYVLADSLHGRTSLASLR